jgi:hypothetical protein
VRYYRKPPLAIVPVGMLVVLLRYLLQGRSLLTSVLDALAGGIPLALLVYVFHKGWYWEVGETRLVHRRLLRRTTFPFSDITYVGPMTGEGSEYEFFEKTILVRTAEGQRMFIDTTDPDALLAEMRQHLPGITLNL